MVICAWFLILLLFPVSLHAAEKPIKINLCLVCHAVHYSERGDCIDCHRGVPDTQRIDIAHSGLIAARFAAFTIEGSPIAQRGEQRLKDYACRRCHISGGTGNRLAADLDLAQRDATPEELSAAIKSPVLFMPQFHFTEPQRVELVNGIMSDAARIAVPEGELP
ncbi:MAG: cytochrome c, partial [Desulfofustis sp.]|nr:cytochrome c [Desulfofustis sp.]